MDENESFSERAEGFIGGKGFYIVLFVSLAVVAASAWLLIRNRGEAAEDYEPITIEIPDETIPVETPIWEPSQPVITAPQHTEASQPVSEDKPYEETGLTEAAEEPVPEAQPVKAEPEPVREDEPESAPAASVFIMPVSGEVTQEYSPGALAYSRTMDDWRTHHGVDIGAEMGAKIKAAADGTVKSVVKDDLMGTVVTIEHSGGVTTVYANLAATPTVKAGDSVTMGAVIGSVGDTALGEISEPAHLHLEAYRDGKEIDPRTLVEN